MRPDQGAAASHEASGTANGHVPENARNQHPRAASIDMNMIVCVCCCVASAHPATSQAAGNSVTQCQRGLEKY